MKKYVAEPPNFNYTISDYISVFNSMRHLQSYKEIEYPDERVLLEDKIQKYLNIKYALTVTSCAAGIDLACEAIGLNENDEVLACAINFYGTHLSVLRYKAKLIFVEPKDNSVQIDPLDMYKKISKNTKAVIITQMNGSIADMNEIKKYIKEKEKQYNKKIYIIEDVARSFGAEYFNSKAGTLGDVGIFSFQTKKNYCTLGEGGVIVTNNDEIYNKLKELRAFGDRRVYGTNYKLSRVQCSVGLTQLKKLDKNNNKRIKVALERNELLREYLSDVYIDEEDKNIKKIYTYYNVILNEKYTRKDRENIRAILLDKYNIQTCIANEPTYITHLYVKENVDSDSTPLATSVGGRIISLPIHFKMKRKDNVYIVNSLIKSIEEVKNGNV